LKYIDAADLASEKVRIVPIAERKMLDLGPDADDLVALRKRPNLYNSARGVVGGGNDGSPKSIKTAKKDSRLVMDGLARKETSFAALQITSAATNIPVSKSPPKSSIFAYTVSSKDSLQSWTRKHAAIILLPSEIGWRSKSIRVLADEIAFITQSTVIVPDIYRGDYYSSLGDGEISVASREGIKYLLQAHLTDRSATADSSQSDGGFREYRPTEILDPQSYPDSRCSGSMNEWVQTQRSNNRTIFDDIVSAIRFARTEYDAKSISLAGIGYGGGLALEASCFIHDIARSAQLQEIEDAFYSSNYFKDINQSGDHGEDVFASYVEGLMIREESLSKEEGYHQSRELKLLRDVLRKYDGVFMKPSAQVLELTEKKSAMGLDLDEQSMKSIDEVFEQFINVDNTVAQASRSQVEAEMKEEQVNDDQSRDNSLSEYDDLMRQMEDEASSEMNDDESWQDEFRQEMRGVNDAVSAVGDSEYYSAVKSEWVVISKAIKRAADRALLAPYGSLYTSDFLELVPKAVVAICPNRYSN